MKKAPKILGATDCLYMKWESYAKPWIKSTKKIKNATSTIKLLKKCSNLMAVRVYLSPDLSESDDDRIKRIARDFKLYKSTDDEGELFGRDAIFHRPSDAVNEELAHVHL